MRLGVYVDDVYRRDGEQLSAELAFPLFAAGLGDQLEQVVLLGRLDPRPGRAHHLLPRGTAFRPLPFYGSLTEPATVMRALLGTLQAFWRGFGEVDAVWLLGPHPLALLAIPLALARRRRVILGVRQNTAAYAAHRHRDNRRARQALGALEASWRALARVVPVVVVGPELGELYGFAPRLMQIVVSLVDRQDVIPAEQALCRPLGSPPRVLSVGRLDPEKNPLMLADVAARLRDDGRPVKLVVCGEGSLADALAQRVQRLGLDGEVELTGYIPIDAGLGALYAEADVFLHVSWTEGVPQVLFEAAAAGLPIVATAVGGVAAFVRDAALLVEPGDPSAAAAAVRRVLDEAGLRDRLIRGGAALATSMTRQEQSGRLAAWLRNL